MAFVKLDWLCISSDGKLYVEFIDGKKNEVVGLREGNHSYTINAFGPYREWVYAGMERNSKKV